MGKMPLATMESGLQAAYASTVAEPVPASMLSLLASLGVSEPGAMGGKAPGSMPIAGGESARG